MIACLKLNILEYFKIFHIFPHKIYQVLVHEFKIHMEHYFKIGNVFLGIVPQKKEKNQSE
jgi:hypothetical protein